MKRKAIYFLPLFTVAALAGCKKNDDPAKEEPAPIVQFVFTSDAHYGITRANFQGAANVDAHTVNAAMVAKMNTLPDLTLPDDGGVNAGKKISGVMYPIPSVTTLKCNHSRMPAPWRRSIT